MVDKLSSYTTDKGLITRKYKEHKKPDSQNINDPMKKWANELNRAFSMEEVQMTKNQIKKCSTSLTVKKMQIKTTLRFHLTPVRMTIIRNINNKCWQGCGGKRSLTH
jgi:hypothetical protein